MSAAALTLRFFRRELRDRFAGAFTGGLWALLQPLFQLAIYAFVFVQVLKQKIPGADAPGFVPFLVTALWPWTAFSEALTRATTVVQDNAALIGKVALPREVLVVATVASSFAIHIAGFVAILLVMRLAGVPISMWGLVPALTLFVPLFALTLGLALMLASVQVFVRDLAQALPQIMMLLMFATPIFFDRAQMPEYVRGIVQQHPFTFYAEAFRALLLHHGTIDVAQVATAVFVAAIVLLAGHTLFRRLDPHFEDFL